jgi:hypothetical protein
MKIQFITKTPDIVYEITKFPCSLDAESKERFSKWFKYGENLMLEYDSENDTMTVIKLRGLPWD